MIPIAPALLQPRISAFVLFIASVSVLSLALWFQFFQGLEPCVLCHYQRIPYVITSILSMLAFVLAASGQVLVIIHGLTALVFLVGAGIAGYHFGIEQQWWRGVTECTGADVGSAKSISEIRSQVMTAPLVRCDNVSWSLLGVSMAGYNFLISLGLMAAAIFAACLNIGRKYS